MKKRWIAPAAAACVLAALTVWTIWGNTALQVTTYPIRSSRVPESLSHRRILQISDFHNAEFGEGNSRFKELAAELHPDLIVITGDLIDRNHTDVDVSLDMTEALTDLAEVYYVTGNHEAASPDYERLREGLERQGVHILSDEAARPDGFDGVTLIGLQEPPLWSGNVVSRLSDLMADTEDYTIVLSHHPEVFLDYAACGADLVFTGHAHGGQFRLPFVGGLIAPNQGFFPKYDAGLFTSGQTTMVVSRGLGNSVLPLRFNNRPELVVAEFERIP